MDTHPHRAMYTTPHIRFWCSFKEEKLCLGAYHHKRAGGGQRGFAYAAKQEWIFDMNIAKWVLSLAVGGFLIVFGITKFTGGAHIFPLIEMKATAIGFPLASLFFPLVNYATGALELLAGVLVILPMTRKSIGAPLAVLPFLGAVVFHISPLLGVITPNGYALTEDGSKLADAALKAGGGFEPSHFTPETGPMLFILAAVFLVLAAVNAALHRGDA